MEQEVTAVQGAGQGAEQTAGQGGLWEGSALLSHLLPATQYHAKVVTRNAFGFSQPSRVFNFATKGAGEDISKATRLPMFIKPIFEVNTVEQVRLVFSLC